MAGHYRFFVDPSVVTAGEVTLTGQTAHQIGRVLRLKPGDEITLLDGSGNEIETTILAISRDAVRVVVRERKPSSCEPRLKLTLAVCLPKNDKIEMIAQKCTELGISELVVLDSERVIGRPTGDRLASRIDRWRRIATEAAEQSERARVPEIRGLVPFGELVASIPHYGLALIAWEEESGASLREALHSPDVSGHPCPETPHPNATEHPCPETALLIVGPEGGLSEREVGAATAAGARAVSLGKRLLRVETAAIAACAVIMAELDR